jgi:hypothetical protein
VIDALVGSEGQIANADPVRIWPPTRRPSLLLLKHTVWYLYKITNHEVGVLWVVLLAFDPQMPDPDGGRKLVVRSPIIDSPMGLHYDDDR